QTSPGPALPEPVGHLRHHVSQYGNRAGRTRDLQRIDLVDRVGRRVVDEEVVAVDLERHRRNVGLLHAGTDVGAATAGADGVGVDPAEQRGDVAHFPAPGVAAGEAEAGGTEDAAVRLQHHDVVRQLFEVRVAISLPAAAAVLLVGPQHDP